MSSPSHMASRPVHQSAVDQLGSHMQNLAIQNPPASNLGAPGSPKTGRRRLNQAQRRNMSSQFVIPVDPRAQDTALPPPQPQPHHRHMPDQGRGQPWRQNPAHGGPPHHHQHSQGFNGGHQPWNHPQNHRNHHQHPQNYQNHQSHHQHPQNYQNHHNNHHYNRGGYPQNTHNHHQQYQHANHHPQGHRPYGSAGDFHHQASSLHYDHSPRQHHQSSQSWAAPSQQSRPQMDKCFAYLDKLSSEALQDCEISADELASKNQFRATLEIACREAVTNFEKEVNNNQDFPPESVQLRCFGSIASGFATKGSDMDLGLVTPHSKQQPDSRSSPIPRLIEKAFLDLGYGARLLSRTRVPIIKLCEKPSSELFEQLLKERERWEKGLSHEDDDPPVPANPANTANAPSPGNKPTLSNANPPAAETGAQGDTTQQPLLLSGRISLSQQSGHSLSSYFTTAKKLLLQLQMPDLEENTFDRLDPITVLTLNKICYAFIQGLSDDKLKNMVMALPSNQFTDEEMEPSLPAKNLSIKMPSTFHSVATTVFQIEAVENLQRWDAKPSGLDANHEADGSAAARELRHLLRQEISSAQEASAYARHINSALARFKQLPVVQATCMEQRPSESPLEYYNRANRIFRSFSPSRGNASDQMTRFFLYYFVQGVHKPEIREALEAFSKIGGPLHSPTLADLSLRLMTLQLASDFQIAHEKGVYTEEQDKIVLEYMAILRRPLAKLPTAGARAWYKYALPMLPEEKSLIEKVKAIGDPALLSPARERYRDELEFPKEGVGAQCDVNFSAHLALQNSTLLRCYSHTDVRVRQMVLFVKRWAKTRQINTPYRGSLSSYGYALMVLHFLVNIADPFVCPNLQKSAPPKSAYAPAEYADKVECHGYDVRFMRDEEALIAACEQNTITANTDSLGTLLCGFFEYFAQSGPMLSIPARRGFDWGREVLSLRTFHGGILTKQAKNWTGAKTVLMVGNANAAEPAAAGTSTTATATATATAADPPAATPDVADVPLKEVRCRYLFAIEDPFEIDHNVARTVTHHGISGIRDEFRRAWRLIQSVRSSGVVPAEALLEPVSLVSLQDKNFLSLLESIHAH
ncbi:uncharacterized protein BROUX77_005601 [Berkeleyomyces rouxiae]|uniref:uncharacterized protein n=1 Tax=Berkeleyomyces rouxiae TaxID=2035830 RepID=UPI003B7DFF89